MSQHVLFAGGKSGGHVFPALAVAEELVSRGWTVGFLGTESGLEARLVRSRRLPFYAVRAEPVVGRGLVGRTRAVLVLARSALAVRSLVRRLGARVVFGTGGFVSVPGVIGGWLARARIFLFEPNAVPGAANRLLSRLAQHAAVAFESAAAGLHCSSTVTGVPVRAEFFAPHPSPPPSPLRVLVLGGSQGSRRLNETVPPALASIVGELDRLDVVHQTGEQERALTAERYAKIGSGGLHVEVVAFVDDVAGAMAASHLVICRAGAITLAEVTAAGRPSVLVPLTLAGAHQAANAAALEAAGAAVVLSEETLLPEALAARLRELLLAPQRLAAMGTAARRLARRDASARIADRMEELFEGSAARGGAPS